jgi:hypothetical protein
MIINWIATKILGGVGKRLDGYKSNIGAGGKIILGIGTCCTAITAFIKIMFPNDFAAFPDMDTKTAFATFGVGIALISTGIKDLGSAGKQEKQKAAVIEQTTVIAKQTQAIHAQNILLAAQTVPDEKIKAQATAIAKGYIGKPDGDNDNPSGISSDKTQAY